MNNDVALFLELWEDDYESLVEIIKSLDTYAEPTFTEIQDVEGEIFIIDLTRVTVIAPAQSGGEVIIYEEEHTDYDDY